MESRLLADKTSTYNLVDHGITDIQLVQKTVNDNNGMDIYDLYIARGDGSFDLTVEVNPGKTKEDLVTTLCAAIDKQIEVTPKTVSLINEIKSHYGL